MECLEYMKGMETASVDMILTDPPYFIPANHYSTRKKFKRNFADLGILDSWFGMVFKEFERILKPTGTMYIFCDGQSYPLFFWHSYSFCKSVKPLIWDKQASMNGYGWRHQHEIILWAEGIEKKKIPTGDGDIIRMRGVPVKERTHPAQKPVELLEKLLLKSTEEGELVFDPFTGSGTCALACQKTNRRFIGCELSPDYYKSITTITTQNNPPRNFWEKTITSGLVSLETCKSLS